MEHILQFTINIDDEAIKKMVLESASNKISAEISNSVKSRLVDMYGSPRPLLRDTVRDVVEPMKDKIIEKAVEELIDVMRRSKKYREALASVVEELMTGNEYQKLAMRTNDGSSTHRLFKEVKESLGFGYPDDFGGIIMACLGLSGEVGEFNDLIKKLVFHESDLDLDHVKKELGDVLWYVAMACQSFGWKMDDIMEMNIEKLRKRYPDGFNVYDANHRRSNDI